MKPIKKRSGVSPLLYLLKIIMVQKAFLLFLICIPFATQAQKQDYIWCFGDSAGLDFNSGIPVPFQSGMRAHEAATAISSKQGSLLFYCGDRSFSTFYSGVRNQNHQMMQNGDSLFANGSITNGQLTIPFPNDSNKYFIFHIGSFQSSGYVFYSVIDISLQGGDGEVILKNIILNGIANPTERIAAIKHANGRDWWVITKPLFSDLFILFLVTPFNIIGPFQYSIGVNYSEFGDNIGEIATSQNGDKIASVTTAGKIDVFNFDRCTGLLSNWTSIGPVTPSLPLNSYYGCEFSPNGDLLYVTTIYPPYSQLLQYNLLSSTPWVPYYIYTNSNDSVSFGQLQRGPDNKLYMTSCNPYFTSTFDSLNMYIGVINEPDSIGLACNFAPYSVYLGGRRSFYSLPNMPNYNLGTLVGSPCDTLTSIHSIPETKQGFEIIPNPVNSDFRISLSGNVEAENYFELRIFNMNGKLVYQDKRYIVGEKINCLEFSSGLYAITLTRNGRMWFNKFIKL